MKLRTTRRSRNVILEIGPRDSSLPPVPLQELRLNRILLPVDFSDCSRKAMTYASSFARQFQAELLLLHAVEPAAPAAMAAEFVPPEGESLEEAAKLLATWRNTCGAPSSKAVIRTGVAHQEIVRAAEEGNVDLIVIGTHGRRGLVHFLLGSTAERVVREAGCPVLVVREREHDFVESGAGSQGPRH